MDLKNLNYASIPAGEKWWELFQSPVLDELIRRGMAKSHTDAAQAALKQAREKSQGICGFRILSSNRREWIF